MVQAARALLPLGAFDMKGGGEVQGDGVAGLHRDEVPAVQFTERGVGEPRAGQMTREFGKFSPDAGGWGQRGERVGV